MGIKPNQTPKSGGAGRKETCGNVGSNPHPALLRRADSNIHLAALRLPQVGSQSQASQMVASKLSLSQHQAQGQQAQAHLPRADRFTHRPTTSASGGLTSPGPSSSCYTHLGLVAGHILPPILLSPSTSSVDNQVGLVLSSSHTNQATLPAWVHTDKVHPETVERPASTTLTDFCKPLFPLAAGWRPDQPRLKKEDVRDTVREILFHDSPSVEIGRRKGGIAFQIPLLEVSSMIKLLDNDQPLRVGPGSESLPDQTETVKRPCLSPVQKQELHIKQLINGCRKTAQCLPLLQKKAFHVSKPSRSQHHLKQRLDERMKASEVRRLKLREMRLRKIRKQQHRRLKAAERRARRKRVEDSLESLDDYDEDCEDSDMSV